MEALNLLTLGMAITISLSVVALTISVLTFKILEKWHYAGEENLEETQEGMDDPRSTHVGIVEEI